MELLFYSFQLKISNLTVNIVYYWYLYTAYRRLQNRQMYFKYKLLKNKAQCIWECKKSDFYRKDKFMCINLVQMLTNKAFWILEIYPNKLKKIILASQLILNKKSQVKYGLFLEAIKYLRKAQNLIEYLFKIKYQMYAHIK